MLSKIVILSGASLYEHPTRLNKKCSLEKIVRSSHSRTMGSHEFKILSTMISFLQEKDLLGVDLEKKPVTAPGLQCKVFS